MQRIWAMQPGAWFCLSWKSQSGTWHDEFFKRNEIGKIRSYIREHQDKNLYACPHGFTKPRRLGENAVAPKLLWADLDEVDPRDVKIKPTMAWETSPGRYAAVWLTDAVVTAELNKRWTYYLGADKGGWDYTQVLRTLPGCINYKYKERPRVKLLWDDGDEVKIAEIERLAPGEKQETRGSGGDSKAIYEKYERALPPWVRRELLNGKPTVGKRSEMFWKLGHALIEAGLSRDEALTLLKASPWNKFAGRHDEDKQLERELDKALEEKIGGINGHKVNGHKVNGETPRIFLARSMEEVEEENIDWLWYPYIARGEMSILEGDPGLGKSYVAEMIGGAFVDGTRLPSVKRLPTIRGPVCYFDIENSQGAVTKKRLVCNGIKNLARFYQEDQFFTIDDPDAMDGVYEALKRVQPVLTVFDTINTYIGKSNTSNAAETTQALATFKEIATQFNTAVIVLRHLTKGVGGSALYRGQGSIAFTGTARTVMTVQSLPEDDTERVLSVTKINIAKRPPSIKFRIEALPDTLKETDRSQFIWGEFDERSTDEIMQEHEKNRREGNDDDSAAIEEWLKDTLDSGGKRIIELKRMAEMKSFDWKQVSKIARKIEVARTGAGDREMWSLGV